MASELQTLEDISRSGDLNPVQRTRLDQLRTAGSAGNPYGIESTGIPTTSAGSGYSTQDVIANAQKLRDFTIQSNQPAIQSLQTEKGSLSDRYSKLLDSIKGQQGVAENSQIRATSNELGRRGINNQSGLYDQQQADALRPLDAQYQGLTAQTGLNQEKDMSDIQQTIASLQTGNPQFAVQTGQGLAQSAQQADQFSQNLAFQQSEAQKQRENALAVQQLIADRLQKIGAGGLYDPTSGQVIGGVKPASAGGNSSANLPPLSAIFGY